MSFNVKDRVLVKPLGVKGTVIRFGQNLGLPVVQADSGGPPMPWNENDLEKLVSAHHPAETDDEAAYYASIQDRDD